jgi:hypothetical protein
MTVTITPIGVGAVEGDGTGDKARTGAQSINTNEANIKAAIEELQGRFWTIQNSSTTAAMGSRYMANNHAGITLTMPGTFAVSSTDLSDIWVTNADDASNVTLTPASGDAFFVDGATHGVDTSYAVTPGNLVILSPRTTNSEWDLIVVGSGGGGGAFTADGDTQITPSTAIVLDQATGNEVALDLAYTTNKATSGDDTGLKINQTDTASPGTSLLIDAQVGGTTKFSVNNVGTINFTSTGYIQPSGNRVIIGGEGTQYRFYQNSLYVSGKFEINSNVATSTTIPMYTIDGDENTGVGFAAADQVNLIAGALEGLRVEEGNNGTVGTHIFIPDLTTAPTGNPTGGGYFYTEAGALKYRGSSGTVTTIANA